MSLYFNISTWDVFTKQYRIPVFEPENFTAKVRVFKSFSQIFYVHKRFLIKQATFPSEGKILFLLGNNSPPLG